MILEITRGHIRMEIEGKKITILGEAYFRGSGSPDFVVYSNSIRNWDAPDSGYIDKYTKEKIIRELYKSMKEKNMTIEIE